MPLTPNFSISQSQGAPTIIDLTDDSTGSDVAVTQRRAFLQQSNAAYLVPTGTTTNYVQWAYANPSIAIDALTKSTALNITIQWLSVTNVVLYTKTILANFNLFNQDFNYSLVYDEATGLASLNSPNWLMSRMKLYVALQDAYTATVNMSNIGDAQSANERATWLSNNKNEFY